MASILCLILASPLHGSPAIERTGVELSGSPQSASSSMREALALHPGTELEFDRVQGRSGAVLLVRERVHGILVAGGRLALRVDGEDVLRSVVGRSLRRDVPLPAPPERIPEGAMWWPTTEGLELARAVETPLVMRDGVPESLRLYVAVADGRILASESLLDDVGVELVGWLESPATTPDLVTFDVELVDQDPLVLESSFVRVFHCPGIPDECVPESFPAAVDGVFPDDPPPFEDDAGHQDPEDPFASIQAMQYAARFEAALVEWGWDPVAVWSNLDCEWQEVESDLCRLWIHTNVLESPPGEDFLPFDGAFYRSRGQIFMGQGAYADSSFDGQVLTHEIGHHVTHGWGTPEPTGRSIPADRTYLDRAAINEGSSDVYASFFGTSDELFIYFRNAGGLYQGPRTRDVSIPFRCPENVAGESHMEGRIWASAIHDAFTTLVDAGLSDENGFPTAFNLAMAAIRQIPREDTHQFPEASQILIDTVDAELGAEAASVVSELFLERGLLECDYQIDIAQEPSITGEGDPEEDPYHARFLILPSHGLTEAEETLLEHPIPPAVDHIVTLSSDQGGLALRFVPDRWRTTKRVDEPLDQEGLVAAALVRQGSEGLGFTQDPDTKVWSHEADLEFTSAPDPDLGEPWHLLEITGLDPGETYSIAFVSFTAVEDDLFLMDRMEYEFLPVTPDGSDESGEETNGSDDDDADGCACGVASPSSAALWPLVLFVFFGRPRRSRPITRPSTDR